ncbi:MAG: hypothetical protein L7F78_04870 [Syntrophales bacterium LBB04]|nr:hypothetical protein [Syntrophales bacterium LBB04]
MHSAPDTRHLTLSYAVIHSAFFTVDDADKVPNMAGYKRRRSYLVH